MDFYSSHEAARKAHQHDTSNWFISSDDFTNWHKADQSVLWISGFRMNFRFSISIFTDITIQPAQVKRYYCRNSQNQSYLSWANTLIIYSSATVEYMQNSPRNLNSCLAFFYCDFRKVESRDPLNVMGSIVAQLCSKLEWIPAELENYYEKATSVPGHDRKADLSTLQQALTSIAQEHKVFVLIDALDECDSKENILTVIKDLERQKLRLNILLTSRNERDIQDELQASTRLRIESRLSEMTEDINSYVTSRIDQDRRLRQLNITIRQNIKDVLNSRAKGM